MWKSFNSKKDNQRPYLNSNLSGLMRDVDSYISELNEQQQQQEPTYNDYDSYVNRTTSKDDYFNTNYDTSYSAQQSFTEPPPLPPPRSSLRHANTIVQPSTVTPIEPFNIQLNEPPIYDKNDYVNTYLGHSEKCEIESDNPSRFSDNRSSNMSSTTTDSGMMRLSSTQLKHTTSVSSMLSSLSRNLSSSETNTPVNSHSSSYAFMSILGKAFIRRVKSLEHVRELFCANEYPESFTGQEAIRMIHHLLDGIPESHCILVANALMKATPPLFDPTHYSQKSIIQGTVFNSPDEYYTLQEDMLDEQIPTGILTSLLDCYTYGCVPGKGGCYAPRCPNKPEIFALEFDIQDTSEISTSKHRRQSSHATSTHPQMAWAQRAPRELLESLSKKEIARQEAINEMIYSEEVYKKDLETLSELIVAPLLKKSIIASPKKREEFVKEVFGNYKELLEVSTALFTDLLDLQNQDVCVSMIGDVLIKHFAYFEDPFTKYCPRVSLAEYLYKEEEKNNPDFERFIVHVEKSKKMRRLAFRHFLLNPVTRMQRYPLLLDAILKKTDEDHPDYTYLTKCMDMVKKVASQSDTLADIYKRRVEILEINDAIVFKQGEYQDLQLTDPHRRLYYQGDIKRKSNGIEMTEKSDIHIFIFDHLLLMTKVRKSSSTTSAGMTIVEEFRVWRKPIPLQLLYVTNHRDIASTTSASGTRHILASTTTGYLHSTSSVSSAGFSLTLYHLGRHGGEYAFTCTTDEKQTWLSAIEEAKTSFKKRYGNDVFEVVSLDDTSFRNVAAVKYGRVNCTVAFTTSNNERKLAVGTDTGVYFKSLDTGAVKKALSCENVKKLAVLDKYHILLVLTEKTFKAYPLGLVNSPIANGKSPERLGQELGQHVHFFQVGYCNNKELVVFKKKKNTSSIFTALEPVVDLRDPKNQKYITQKTGFMIGNRSNHSWFKKYKEFYVGAESSNIHFLKSKLLIVCERGFEIIDPENLSVGGRDIPDKEDPQFNFVHRQADSIRPLAMYRVNDKFLLCYDKFAFYVNNRNGSLVQRGPQKSPLLCEWEGNPENIVFQYPYVIAFDPRFIEIRHVDTGDLVQVIPGDQIRLTQYQAVGETTSIQGCMTHTQRFDSQNLFQLVLNPQRIARKYL